MSVSSFESEGFPYCRRSRAEFLWLLDSLYHGQPGKFPEGDWYGFLFRRNPPLPPLHPLKHHQTGDWKGMRLGVFVPPKNLPNTAKQLEK